MGGDIDLGKDGNKAIGGIADDPAHVVLCIEAAIGCRFVRERRQELAPATSAFDAPGTMLGEGGKAFDLETPALVVAEMEVKGIEFIADHFIDVAFDLLFGEEVAADVEHEAAPSETGVV